MVRRFRRELDVLARMDHPGIARVYDAGLSESGQPFFVMELVEGTPIDLYCQARGLGIEARLRLLAAVCDAVQHAHAKSVVHRDLKPSNVLVVETEGSPRPVIIDFGIAKALDDPARPDLTTAGALTALGTPAYMSPEQTIPAATDIDTRTDVYSLGVLLYQLITGEPPFTMEQAQREAGGDILRLIRESETPRPLSRPCDQTLGGRLPRELDWITLRCLAKRPGDRYQTAAELGEELRRLWRGEPVAVGPPSAWYRASRLVRRRPLLSTMAGAVLLAVIIGGSLASIGLVQAERARQAEAARLAEAEEVAGFFEGALTSIEVGEAAGEERRALAGLVDQVTRGLDEGESYSARVELRLRRTLRGAYDSLGVPEQSVEQSRRIMELVTTVYGGRSIAVAEERLEQWDRYVVLDMRDELLGEGDQQIELAESVAGKYSELALNSRRRVALTLEQRGRYEEAERAYRSLIADREAAAGPTDPALQRDLRGLAVLLARTGREDESFALFNRIYEIQCRTLPPDEFDRVLTRLNIAVGRGDRGEYEAAVSELRAVIEIWTATRGLDDRWTAWAYYALSEVHARRGDTQKQIEVLEEAVALLRARRERGQSTEWARDLVPRLATALRGTKRGEAAKALIEEWGMSPTTEHIESFQRQAPHQ